MEHTPHRADCENPTLRSSGALALLAIFCLLAACGSGSTSSYTGSSLNAASGTATLAWNAPTAGNILGYKVYYGTASGMYGQGVDVRMVNSYSVAGLSSGATYYFVTTAYDASNSESAYSNEISTVIP